MKMKLLGVGLEYKVLDPFEQDRTKTDKRS